MATVAESLFGVTPESLQRQRQQQLRQEAMDFASISDPSNKLTSLSIKVLVILLVVQVVCQVVRQNKNTQNQLMLLLDVSVVLFIISINIIMFLLFNFSISKLTLFQILFLIRKQTKQISTHYIFSFFFKYINIKLLNLSDLKISKKMRTIKKEISF